MQPKERTVLRHTLQILLKEMSVFEGVTVHQLYVSDLVGLSFKTCLLKKKGRRTKKRTALER